MLGYCTNVHSGNTFDEVIQNLKSYSSLIQRNVKSTLGIGLWLSNNASNSVDLPLLKDTLQEHNLQVFTMNGFPYGDFHHKSIQHNVYKPNWSEQTRLDYTIRLAHILAEITPKKDASISTLPLGWNSDSFSDDDCAAMLKLCVGSLEEIEQETGKCIHVDLEAEPGCRLQLSKELCDFIEKYFGDNELTRRYIRVCHDTCHSAVMRENVKDCITNYKNAGLSIGKVQLSSAVEFDFESTDLSDAWHFLTEPTYLHQTTIGRDDDFHFFDTFSNVPNSAYSGLCKVHFHVPIYLDSFGELDTTQYDLLASIPPLKEAGVVDWEIETYTWSVTPKELQTEDLVDSITKELEWATAQINK
jgi:hypothetical protein